MCRKITVYANSLNYAKQTLSEQKWKVPSSLQVKTICIYHNKTDDDAAINNVDISPVTSGDFRKIVSNFMLKWNLFLCLDRIFYWLHDSTLLIYQK